MSSFQVIILLRFMLAHVIGDFLLQPDSWIKDKNEKRFASVKLYAHGFIHALLAYIFVARWNSWFIIPVIFFTHVLIDVFKTCRRKPQVFWFLADQFLHILVIGFIWYLIANPKLDIINHTWSNKEFLAKLLAYTLVTLPASIFISQSISTWKDKLLPEENSLIKAGIWVGIIERVLIITFIFLKQYEPIGFLLAAKSVFRFGELKETKDKDLTEYILVGTLLSFGIAILVGLTVNYYLHLQ